MPHKPNPNIASIGPLSDAIANFAKKNRRYTQPVNDYDKAYNDFIVLFDQLHANGIDGKDIASAMIAVVKKQVVLMASNADEELAAFAKQLTD